MLPGPFASQADSTALSGGQLVKVANSDTVTPTTGISDAVLGTVLVDTAPNALVKIKPLAGGVHHVIASAPVTAGTVVEPSTVAGQVQPLTSGTRVGIALTTAAGSPLRLKILG